MKILMTGGHSELLWDMSRMFKQNLGKEVILTGGSPNQKRPKLEWLVDCKFNHHETIWQCMLRYEKEVGSVNDPMRIFGALKEAPSLTEYCSREARDSIQELVRDADLIYGYLPAWVAIYYPYKRHVSETSLHS